MSHIIDYGVGIETASLISHAKSSGLYIQDFGLAPTNAPLHQDIFSYIHTLPDRLLKTRHFNRVAVYGFAEPSKIALRGC